MQPVCSMIVSYNFCLLSIWEPPGARGPGARAPMAPLLIRHCLLSRCSLGIKLGEYQRTDLYYADDIAIFGPSACMLQEALIILQEETNIVGMQISWPNIKLMAITPNPTSYLSFKATQRCTPIACYTTAPPYNRSLLPPHNV